ncbi:MAG: hypothetical protein J6W81_08795 [Lentisphaeria bacterium]|nr:hypothetical protein [Lentisphaeria bacterium]
MIFFSRKFAEKWKKSIKNQIFLKKNWKNRERHVILIVLFALNCAFLSAGEVHRTIPKTALELENELRMLRTETEKRLAKLTNERDRLKAELKNQRDENSLVRKELIETLEKYSMLAEKLKRYETSAAAVIETLAPNYSGAREDDKAESLRTVMQSSVALASATVTLCNEVEKMLDLPGVDSVRAAKLKAIISNLKSEIRNVVRFNVSPATPAGFSSCRVLNIDPSLKAAVFSAGYRNGLRSGMILRTSDSKTQFQVILLKNYTALGLLQTGSLSSIGIGTKLYATSETSAK